MTLSSIALKKQGSWCLCGSAGVDTTLWVHSASFSTRRSQLG